MKIGERFCRAVIGVTTLKAWLIDATVTSDSCQRSPLVVKYQSSDDLG
jgi:hypothetical protein